MKHNISITKFGNKHLPRTNNKGEFITATVNKRLRIESPTNITTSISELSRKLKVLQNIVTLNTTTI